MTRISDTDLRAEVARLEADGQYERALTILEKARKESDSVTAALVHGGLLTSLGRWAEAEALYAAMDIAKVTGDDLVHLHLVHASSLLALKRNDEAIVHIREAVAGDPHFNHGRLALSLADQAGGAGAVLDVLDVALDSEDPGRWRSAVDAGLQGTLRDLGAARVAKATGDDATFALAVDHIIKGPLERWTFDSLCRLQHPFVMRLAARQAENLAMGCHFDRALLMRELSVSAVEQLGPGFEDEEIVLRYELAEARFSYGGDIEGARAEYERAAAMLEEVEVDAGFRANLMCGLGRALIECEAQAEAEEALTAALEFSRQTTDKEIQAMVLHEQAILAWNRDDDDRALEILDQAWRSSPASRATLSRTRAVVLADKGEAKGAIAAARAAVELAEPGSQVMTACQLELALLLVRFEGPGEEARALARAVSESPNAQGELRARAKEILEAEGREP